MTTKENIIQYIKKIAPSLFCILFFVYLEIMFHIFTYRSIGDFIYLPILFALPAGFLLLFLTSLFTEKVNKVLLWVLLPIISLLYIVQTVYQNVFKTPLLFTNLSADNVQVIIYYREIFTAIWNCLPAIILMLLPLVVYGILLKFHMKPKKKNWITSILIFSLALNLYGGSRIAIDYSKDAKNNIYDNFHKFYDSSSAMKDYGMITTMFLNIQKTLSGPSNELDNIVIGDPIIFDNPTENDTSTEESIVTENTLPTEDDSATEENNPTTEITTNTENTQMDTSTEETPGQNSLTELPIGPVDPSLHMLGIDFITLANNETDSDTKLIHQYFASIMPTAKNEYTGMFEGYNLIHITAEAFSPYCVDKELTPTLYKLVNNGFVFQNFYVPQTGESTCGGEFMNMTGLLTDPNRPTGTNTFHLTADNYMPYGLGNVFAKIGVSSYAYHNNTLTYYNRIKNIPNLGYTFKASKNGTIDYTQALENGWLFQVATPNSWPQSDLEMISVTGSEYITSDKPFHAYYMTVSGHSNYNFAGNTQARKHQEDVAHLPYSEAGRAYIACNMELDRALENLIEQLDAAGVLEKTVICMTSDHTPYGLTADELNELAGHEVEGTIEQYKNHLILWNSTLTEPIVIHKPCSSIDVVPTLLNLFGFEYDSRLLAGQDILSNSEGYVWFTSNNSFIFGNVMYNSRTTAVTDLYGEPISISSETLEQMKNKGSLKLHMNHLLIEKDYYNIIRGYFN